MSKEKTPVQIAIKEFEQAKQGWDDTIPFDYGYVSALEFVIKRLESIRDNQEKEDRKQLYISTFVDGYAHEIKHGPTLGEQAEEIYNEKYGNHE